MPLPRLLAAVVLLAALVWFGLGRLGGADALPGVLPWAAGRAAAPQPGTSGAAADPAGRFAATLAAAANEADDLARLGEAKSRNLVAIEQGRRRMTNALDAADRAASSGDLPPAAQPAVAAYREGAAAVRGAMADAQQGFLTFDWDRVKRANMQMRDGAAELDRAARLAAGR